MANGRLYHLNHCTYQCQYLIVWVTKYRGKTLADTYIKQELKRIFELIAKWKGFVILEWHIGDAPFNEIFCSRTSFQNDMEKIAQEDMRNFI